MQPYYFTTQSNLFLTIIPDTMAHIDGHPVITYTYSIYHGHSEKRLPVRESRQHLEKIHDPDYMGMITFEEPGKRFVYTPHGHHPLETEDVIEIVEYLSEIRNNPSYWRLS
jgi:hypothetical protein